jgi:hypothetical protein
MKWRNILHDVFEIGLDCVCAVKYKTDFFKRPLQYFADLWPNLMGFSIYI